MEITSFVTTEQSVGFWRSLLPHILHEFTFSECVDNLSRNEFKVSNEGDFWMGFESEKSSEFELFFNGCRFAKGTTDKLELEIPLFLLYGNILVRFKHNPGKVKLFYKCQTGSRKIPLARNNCLDLFICGNLCRILNGVIVQVYQD